MISLSHLNEFVQLTRFKMETVASVLLSVREGDFLASLDPVLSDPNPSIFEEAIEVHVGGDGLPVPSPVFRTVDRSPGLSPGSSQPCQRGHTPTGSDFSGIWTTGWFLPLRSGKPSRPSSRSSRFVTPSGL